jgi:hypothetical protein
LVHHSFLWVIEKGKLFELRKTVRLGLFFSGSLPSKWLAFRGEYPATHTKPYWTALPLVFALWLTMIGLPLSG